MKRRSKELHYYAANLKKITIQAQNAGLGEADLRKIFEDSLDVVAKNDKAKNNRLNLYKMFGFLLSIVLFWCLIDWLLDDLLSNCLFCKIQEFIYPGLKLLRLMSIPIISTFPSLTELYDESCLIENPYFQIADMDCYPCASVNQIKEICEEDAIQDPQIYPPFISKTNQKKVAFEELYNIYKENKDTFDTNASKIKIDGELTIKTWQFFQEYTSGIKSYRWRINRMLPALLIRSLFPRPNVIPRLGQSTERFILFDEPKSLSYSLPEPECNYVFVIQSSGERLIELVPSRECLDRCDKISILLPESYMLWYNWWYWRPKSHSTNNNETSVSYVGSYC